MAIRFLSNRLGRKIVAAMILASATLSVIAAGVQLYRSYERGKSTLLDEFAVIDRSFLKGLEAAVWHFNFAQVDLLLDGIEAQPGVAMLKLSTPTGHTRLRGNENDPDLVIRDFALSYSENGPPEPVGTLTVGISLEPLNRDIWDQFLVLVASNFLKTVFASIAMMIIFDLLVARHLRRIAAFVGRPDWLDSPERLTLARTVAGRGESEDDEISSIVTELERARGEILRGQNRLRRQAEDLRVLNDKLVEANREQAEFTYAISHDLKSPNNTIAMLIEELEETERTCLSEDGQGIIGDMQLTIGRMSRLIDDVLGYARTVGEEIELEPVDLNALLAVILEDMRSDIARAGATITVDALTTVPGNPIQLKLLFQNLLGNAIKFAHPERAPVVTVGPVTVGEGEVSIPISDNGIGIPEVYHARIFSLFQRLHTYDEVPGTGLGLTLCQRVAANHGGRIEVKSSVDEGSTFTVVIAR